MAGYLGLEVPLGRGHKQVQHQKLTEIAIAIEIYHFTIIFNPKRATLAVVQGCYIDVVYV